MCNSKLGKLSIWYINGNVDPKSYPDLDCDITKVDGDLIHFWVINGQWGGSINIKTSKIDIDEYPEYALVASRFEVVEDE